MRKIETYPIDRNTFFHHDLARGQNPYAGIVARWRPVLRRISDATGDSVFLVVRRGSKSVCVHREVGHYPVQVLVVSKGGIASPWVWARQGLPCWRPCPWIKRKAS